MGHCEYIIYKVASLEPST